ncbi:MAG: FHA domain-containing protein [Pseudomonadota bacterium]
MDLASAGLSEQAFKTHGKPLLTVPYAAHREALKALRQAALSPDGLAMLQGPALAGKSTVVSQFVDTLDAECAVAVIDGSGLNTAQLLQAILRQFGYELDYNSANELFGMLRVFALQQAARHQAPLIVIENAHALKASAMRAVCELAALQVRQASAIRVSALRLVLVSNRSMRAIASDDLLEPVLERCTADIHMRPMSQKETGYYLHQKLRAAGSAVPEYVFPGLVCETLHKASGGWPGIADRLALLALAKASSLPVTIDSIEHPALPKGTWDDSGLEAKDLPAGMPPDPPRIVISKDGRPVRVMTLDKERLLVGRSDHNDITIPSRFVSRHHLLLVRNGSSTLLMDLNSTNGTLVNSKRVSNHVLMHNDIVSLGHHRLKFHDPHATSRVTLDGAEFADTAIMKTLEDMRKLLAQENTEVLPAVTPEKRGTR